MAKRMIDSDIWKRRWYRELPVKIKAVWVYLITICDHAGIYSVDLDAMSFFIGEQVTDEEVMKWLGNRITVIDNGKKWFIPKFLVFQYGELNPSNRVHKSVLDKLENNNLFSINGFIKEGSTEGSTEAPKDKDIDKAINKNKAKVKTKAKIKVKRFKAPALEECIEYFKEKEYTNAKNEAERFFYFYDSKGWMVGKNKMERWHSSAANWMNSEKRTENSRVYIQEGDLEKKPDF